MAHWYAASVSIHKAAKAHDCSWCGQRIEVGSEYVKMPFMERRGDGFVTARMHPECEYDCEHGGYQVEEQLPPFSGHHQRGDPDEMPDGYSAV